MTGYYPPHSSQTQQPPPPNGHYYSSQPPPPHTHSGPPPPSQWGHHSNYPPPPHASGPPLQPNALPPPSISHQPGMPPPWDPNSHPQQMPPPTDSRLHPHEHSYHSHPPPHPSSHGQPSHPAPHPGAYSRHGPPPPDSRSQYHAPPHPSVVPPPDLKRKAPPSSAPPLNHPSSMPPPPHHQYHHNLPPTPGAPPPPQGLPPYPLTSPGFHPELRSAHSATSRTPGNGPPMHAASLTSPGGTMFDDDKGRGSYKCGRCGVPKKGHVCPYQPKVKRRPEEPMPELKCVSTQVEMDEFMTLRRLNIEIQGFPESYAAEPIDMVGAEVHPHPPQVLVSGMGSNAPSYPPAPASHPAGHGPITEQSHPTGVPSLASMNSHPRPSHYPPPQGPPYSHQSSLQPPNSLSGPSSSKSVTEHPEPIVLKSEQTQSSDHDIVSMVNGPSETNKPENSSSVTGSTSTSAVEAASVKENDNSPSRSASEVKSEEKLQLEPPRKHSPVGEPKLKTESSESHEAESDSKKRRKV
ncbi:hypothetical protein HJC23_006696 [Cyclotella cryptica]|uniref:Uncharacterized protein n=1 Tax=Cyclotella cryptica TaxID=29204 RepID=A0ABD3QWV0_9STRA|eukprot:CCRYP_001135-RB/>CCRYP_001135-RB protein AED:0.03 eAED:0.03 QI:1075/1/1/1/1/1/2/117/519